jgi:hypothetical protein
MGNKLANQDTPIIITRYILQQSLRFNMPTDIADLIVAYCLIPFCNSAIISEHQMRLMSDMSDMSDINMSRQWYKIHSDLYTDSWKNVRGYSDVMTLVHLRETEAIVGCFNSLPWRIPAIVGQHDIWTRDPHAFVFIIDGNKPMILEEIKEIKGCYGRDPSWGGIVKLMPNDARTSFRHLYIPRGHLNHRFSQEYGIGALEVFSLHEKPLTTSQLSKIQYNFIEN